MSRDFFPKRWEKISQVKKREKDGLEWKCEWNKKRFSKKYKYTKKREQSYHTQLPTKKIIDYFAF